MQGSSNARRLLGVPAAQLIRVATVTLTSAQIKSLSTAVVLVPAQGAGTFTEMLSLVACFVPGTVAYVDGAGGSAENFFQVGRQNSGSIYGGSEIDLTNLSGTGNTVSFRTVVTSTSLTHSRLSSWAAAGVFNVYGFGAGLVNAPVVFQQAGGATRDLVTGDGTLILKLSYRVHTGLSGL